MRILAFVAVAVALGGCAIQRAQIAQDARVQMVGLTKEQVLVCMGPPAGKAAEGQTEVWSYNSGDGTTIASGSVSYGNFSGVSSRRFCQINVVSREGPFPRLTIRGPPVV
jgi:hypothetical protein